MFFILGVLIFTITAFADIMLGSGYGSLKNSVKATAGNLAGEVDNFTVNIFMALKVDGKSLTETTDRTKFDLVSQSREFNGTYLEKGEFRQNYWYSDKNNYIYENAKDGSYNVVEKRKTNTDEKLIENYFERDKVKDAEKVLDAFVGSLENIIQMEESGGKKIYRGNISNTEVPPLINTLSSFVLKYNIMNERTAKNYKAPYPKTNIYFISAIGKAIENEEGILESGIFTASMSAEDNEGKEHIYTLEFSIDIEDINKTVVSAPDLKGKQVTYSKEGSSFDSKYIGKYTNDIVKKENNSFIKLGERFVEINSADGENIRGRYYEVYYEGYEPQVVRNFEFTTRYDETSYYTVLEYTDHEGEIKKGIIHPTGIQNISISFNVIFNEENNGYSYTSYDDYFDSTFIKIFE